MRKERRHLITTAGLAAAGQLLRGRETIAAKKPGSIDPFLTGDFHWKAGPMLLGPQDRDGDQYYAIKDPSLVFDQKRWHLFVTLRGKNRGRQIEYLSASSWNGLASAKRTILDLGEQAGAPQVFFFRPHKRWYLIQQSNDSSRTPRLQPMFSTTTNLSDPSSWSKPAFLFESAPQIEHWIDFWVICDRKNAHLFFTSNNGKLWRSETPLDRFPHGWDAPRVVLSADIFEASHTYHVPHLNQYITMVESESKTRETSGNRRRYFKAYRARDLGGTWEPLADTQEKPFAGFANVAYDGQPWSHSISHGELVRSANDETMPINPRKLQFLYQGVADDQHAQKNYVEIPWRLGLLQLT